MRVEMTGTEHTEKLGNPTLGIVSANAAHMMRLMQPETCYHALYSHFLGDSFWGDSQRGVHGITGLSIHSEL